MRRVAGTAGVFTDADARVAGLDDDWLARAHQAGRVERVHPRAYRVAGAPGGALVHLRAVQASSGRKLLVSHGTAAAFHGFPGFDVIRPYELVVPGSTPMERDGCVIHRTRVLAPRDVGDVHGLPVTSRERTLVDVAGRVPSSRALALVDHVVCHPGGDRQRLHRVALPLISSRPHAALIARLTAPGAAEWFRSWLERRARGVYRDAGLPRCEWNVGQDDARGRRIGEVDCRWSAGRRPVIAELEGLRFHTTPTQRRRDAERFNRLGDVAVVKRFTWEDVVTRPRYVVETIRIALDAVSHPGESPLPRPSRRR